MHKPIEELELESRQKLAINFYGHKPLFIKNN